MMQHYRNQFHNNLTINRVILSVRKYAKRTDIQSILIIGAGPSLSVRLASLITPGASLQSLT